MIQKELEGNDQDQLDDFIGIYGEAYLIKYLSESILDKERIVYEHELN
tara:strand:+ start:502 stop:645 length:144 start_codon:yes stop_codon:yes gene_type:complete